jgi:hypothetical protein
MEGTMNPMIRVQPCNVSDGYRLVNVRQIREVRPFSGMGSHVCELVFSDEHRILIGESIADIEQKIATVCKIGAACMGTPAEELEAWGS